MTSARIAVSEALKLKLGAKYRIIPAAFPPDNVTKPTILVWQDTVTRLSQLSLNPVSINVTAWLLVGIEDAIKAEDALDEGLADLLLALEAIPTLTWSQAERLTFGDPDGPTFHSYRITLNARANIGE